MNTNDLRGDHWKDPDLVSIQLPAAIVWYRFFTTFNAL